MNQKVDKKILERRREKRILKKEYKEYIDTTASKVWLVFWVLLALIIFLIDGRMIFPDNPQKWVDVFRWPVFMTLISLVSFVNFIRFWRYSKKIYLYLLIITICAIIFTIFAWHLYLVKQNILLP